jgi:probable HAF family extracellular repeat protein
MLMLYRGTAALVLVCACSGTPTMGQSYTFVDLGTLGGTTSFARSINNQRQITGNAQTPTSEPSPRLNAFVWNPPNGPMINLGVLPGSNNFSRGYAINDAGVIVGESDNNFSQSFRWEQSTGMTGLLRLLGDNYRGVAHGINNHGSIVGISANASTSRPTIWNPAGIPSDLGSIDGVTTSFGRAWNINDIGTAVGITAIGIGTTSHATMWLGGNVISLGSFEPLSRSEAFAVNNHNIAVGAAVNGVTPSNTPIRRAARWELVAGLAQIQDLGSLGLTFSEAMDINDSGDIVGFATNISGSPQVAWIWSGGVMTDLNTLVQLPSGWVLTAANSINEHGDIAGWGTVGGLTRAFALFRESACYANCDGSTTAPILNVEDFSCFINRFAEAQSLPHEQQLVHYANCDASTTPPVLNVEDFSCFINRFAAGCP